jgi:cytochrome P450
MDTEPIHFYGPEIKRDPYPTYDQLRTAGAVHQVRFPSGVLAWLVTGYDAAVATLSDARLGKNHDLGNDDWRKLASIMPEPQHSQLQGHLLHQDPPKHTEMRRLVLDALAVRRVTGLREEFERIAHDLIDDITGTGAADLVASFAARFPFLVLSATIGLPAEYQRRFRREWCKVVAPVGPASPQRAWYVDLLHGLQGYIDDLVEHLRSSTRDDLLTGLVTAHAEGRLSYDELTSIIFQLLVAGQEPVTNQITTALLALFRHPDQLARLRADPALISSAVEELFRYDGAFELTTWRFFREPTEWFGVQIPAGDSVIVSLGAANRDPAKFADPDSLDFERSPNAHLAFGHGIHFCPGAALGRLELRIAIGALISRLPDLRLDVSAEQLQWINAVLGRGVDHLPVTFSTDTGPSGCPMSR